MTVVSGKQHIEHVGMHSIVKRFPGVLAVDHVDFDVNTGEVHALLGENGAGKSTLMKILYGLYHSNEGTITINGNQTEIRSPSDAIQNGIGMIHQHFMLVPSLTVAENVALGLPSSRGLMLDLDIVADRILQLSNTYGLQVNPHTPIWQLAVGEQQRVEILRALYRGASLLILDEPTAVLTPQEVDDLFRILNQMKANGHSLIFISHKLHEVLAISDRITVLRDGRRVDTIPTAGATKTSLAQMMVGREVVLRYEHTQVVRGKARLHLQNVSALSDRGDLGLKQVSLKLHAGEIVGLAGVSGNGQTELAQTICGLRQATTGKIWLDDREITNHSPSTLNKLGLSHIPEERMEDGVIADFTLSENLILQDHGRKPFALAGTFINFGAIVKRCQQLIRDYEIKTPGTETPIRSLSGGNIQKLVLARELSRQPRVLIAAQPTRGVDIGATEYIHRRLLTERENGTAILLISEDLDEIMALSDRIIVMYEGEIVGEVARADANVNQLGLMMAGAIRQ